MAEGGREQTEMDKEVARNEGKELLDAIADFKKVIDALGKEAHVPANTDSLEGQLSVIKERFADLKRRATVNNRDLNFLEYIQEGSVQEIEHKLQGMEQLLEIKTQEIRRLNSQVNRIENVVTNAYMRWKIPREKVDTSDRRLVLFSTLRYQEGLETWTFKLSLIPAGRGVGEGHWASLTVRLVETEFQLSAICTCEVVITLKNMDSIHVPQDQRTPRVDYQSVIEAGTLGKHCREITFDTFFPHSVFQPYQGYIMEKHILIEAVAKPASREKLMKARCEDWIVSGLTSKNPGDM